MTSRSNPTGRVCGTIDSVTVQNQKSGEADRMKDSIRTLRAKCSNACALTGLLVCLTGCVSPLTKQPWFTPNTEVPAAPSSGRSFTVSPVTGETLTPPTNPGDIDFDPSDINLGDQTSVNAPPNVSQASTFQHPAHSNQSVSQVSGYVGDLATTPSLNQAASQPGSQQPYVARQFPSDPPANYSPPTVLPPSLATAPPSLSTAPPATGNAPPPNYVPPPTSTGVGSGLPAPNAAPPGTPIYGTADGAPMIGNTGIAEPYAPLTPTLGYQPGPTVREADLIINGFPARTGRIMLGGAVNSDAGLTGQLTIDERNFDICRWPKSFRELFSGTAFRGAGQTFRIEAAPGTNFKRYTFQFADPNLLGYKPVSMSVSGFLYDRRFNDWDEERLGARLSFGYRITPDLSISAGITGQRVDMTGYDPATAVQPLADVYGKTSLFSGEASLVHDTRDSPIQASRGHFFEASFEQAFGDFSFPAFELEFRRYWLVAERADGSGKQTLSFSTRAGYTGTDTPIYENFFAGGYATIRGFEFRGASPVLGPNNTEVGGRFQWLNTLEYIFPITADDAFRGVGFVDFGTVEPTSRLSSKTYRVSPGLGLRVALPMLGPAPLAFDFAYPVAKADTDRTQVFSFYMSMVR